MKSAHKTASPNPSPNFELKIHALTPRHIRLRQADEDGWNNGLYWVSRTWIGAPDLLGGWDMDLYGAPPM